MRRPAGDRGAINLFEMSASKQDQGQPLLAEFSPCTYEAWRALAAESLEGATFEKRLISRLSEGVDLQPLYRRQDAEGLAFADSLPGFAPFVRGTHAAGYLGSGWEISQELTYPEPVEFNMAARHDIERGLTGINMVLDRATRNGHDPDWAQPGDVGVWGMSVATLEDLQKALDGIDLEKVSLFVRSGSSALPFAALLVALMRKRGRSAEALRGCIEMDPIGVAAHEGRLPHSFEQAYREMRELLGWALGGAPHLQTVCVHGRAWIEGGGHAVHGLGFSLATGAEYLREMIRRGFTVDDVAPRIRFALTVGSRFFVEIAKLRAARMLWAHLVAALGGSEDSQRLRMHVRTAHRNKTLFDPYVNMLRTTAEAFAGVLGGCDSMQVGPFDEVARTPDEFSRRIARNTQLILMQECHLDRLIDPAGGSWFVENLTGELAQRAWALFQEVERRGGMAAAMREGFPQGEVAAAAEAQAREIAQRREILVGTNRYASQPEEPLPPAAFDASVFRKRRAAQVETYRTASDNRRNTDVMSRLSNIVEAAPGSVLEACIEGVRAGATLGEVTRALRINDKPDEPLRPVLSHRAADGFEKLRLAVIAHGRRSGGRARVFLATMGSLRQHKARADFSRDFFETAGFEVVTGAGFADAESAAAGAAESGARVVVVCSTDETYPELVPPVVAAVRGRQPGAVMVLAGRPEAQVEAHKAAGIDEFIHVRCNAVEILTGLARRAGVEI